MSITAGRIDSNTYSENVASKNLAFVNDVAYTINSGTGSVGQEIASQNGNAPAKVFSGMRSLKVINSNYQNADLVFSNTEDFVSDTPKNFFVSAYFYNVSVAINTTMKLEIFQDAVLYETLIFDLNSTTIPDNEDWYRFGQNVYFDSGFSYTFKWTFVKDATAPSNSKTIYIGGFAIQCLNKGTAQEAPYSLPKDFVLNLTETIDVPSIASNGSETITVTFDGSVVGDNVELVSYPNEIVDMELVVSKPIVYTDGTIKFVIHNPSGGAHDPASGDYTFKIVR